MFAWLKPKTPEEREQAALDRMIDEFRRETAYINDKWLAEIRQRYADNVASVWRDYLVSLEARCGDLGVATLSGLDADARVEIGNVLAEEMIARHKLCRKLRTKTAPTPEYLDAMTAMYAYKHVGSFVTAMSTNRHDFASQYVDQLDAYLAAGSGAGKRFSAFLQEQKR